MVLCGPGAHHRNSIAGSTVPRPIQRIRKGGPLVISSDGPYFSNTTQFYNVFSFNQAESYKLKVMARIEKGFFMTRDIWTCYRRNYFQISTAFCIFGFDHSQLSEVPCLIELPDPLPADFSEEIRQQQDFAMSQAADEQRQLYRIKKEADEESESLGFMAEHSMGAAELDTTRSYNRMTAAAAATASVTEQHSSMPPISGPTRLALVTHFSISISSKIASTSTKIGLIQHTPKRDKGPQFVPSRRDIRGGGNFAMPATTSNQSIATFERVQFKTATANNGKRRAAQQFYILMVDLFAHTQDGRIIRVAASQSDALVVRGRSPGHYTDIPEGEMILSPTSGVFRERRHSSISSHSPHHPYHNTGHFLGAQSRNHSIGAGAAMSVEMSSLNLGLSTAADGSRSGGPLSPISPGGPVMGFGADYSPGTARSVAMAQSFYSSQATAHQGWTDASSMSSPASTYDGSAFSSPTTAYSAFQQYQNGNSGHQQPSPQENGYHHHSQSSYFAQRPSSFGSIPRMMMVGTPGAGVSPGGHSFDSRLETTLENSYETDGSGQDSTGYQQQRHQQGPFESPAAITGSHALYASAAGTNNTSGGYSGMAVAYQQQMMQAGGAFSGQTGEGTGQFSLIKSEPDENLSYSQTPTSATSSAPVFMHPPTSSGHFGHSSLDGMATPTATTTTTSSASSSFGYTLQDLDNNGNGMTTGVQQSSNTLHHQHHPYLPSIAMNNTYEDAYDLNSYTGGDSNSNNKDTSSGYLTLQSVKVEAEY
ncbi:meiosis-specific transcription factor ndt80 [Linnemannia hyalina]|uniref:Meiosis-specific transcription factor ndt80 n=1 Tax=Linnemannia hyalina TaxID=64524 RepID=A0A9P8BND9_9FUNG|nr:meiosis-specific transcription factor ndt80 [Linnemannia hyalina]